MQTEPQIIFRDIEPSAAVQAEIAKRIAGLERVHDRITACRVTIEKRSERGHKGHIYHVGLDLEVPGGHVHVSRKPGDMGAHEDLSVAIRDSFKAARRQLKNHAKKAAAVHVKSHPEVHYGTIEQLFPDEGFGFVKTKGGLEVFFQRASVTGTDWDRLDLGSETSFSLMEGDKGPFAVNLSIRD